MLQILLDHVLGQLVLRGATIASRQKCCPPQCGNSSRTTYSPCALDPSHDLARRQFRRHRDQICIWFLLVTPFRMRISNASHVCLASSRSARPRLPSAPDSDASLPRQSGTRSCTPCGCRTGSPSNSPAQMDHHSGSFRMEMKSARLKGGDFSL